MNIKSIVVFSLAFLWMGQSHAENSARDSSNIATNAANSKIFYFTDRAPISTEKGKLSYGAERSWSLAFGETNLSVDGQGNELVSDANEITRFPKTPYNVMKRSGGITRDPATLTRHAQSISLIHKALEAQIASTRTKEVILYVHGVNNSFDDAGMSASKICNDLGANDFTCISFSWPAGAAKGAFFGYGFDRESGEFAITDLKKSIRFIAGARGLKNIHLIAHSRGADILSSAVQQLNGETYAVKKSFMEEYKIGELILAAPDIDIDIAIGKFAATISDPDIPRVGGIDYQAIYNPSRIHITVYSNAGDTALDMSRSISGSSTRVGLVDARSSSDGLALLEQLKDVVDLISVDQASPDLFGHDYFLSSPNVRGDIVSLIRDKKFAGHTGREIQEIKRPFWTLPAQAYQANLK